MDIIHLLIVLAVIGFAVYALNTWVPMAAPFKTVINVIAVIVLILFVLSWAGMGDFNLGHHG